LVFFIPNLRRKEGKEMRIGVCDDNYHVVQDILGRLPDAQIDDDKPNEYEGFINGHDLLSRFRSKKFDLVFLDIEMPGVDGIKLAKEIRKLNYDCIIIFVSAYLSYIHESYRVDAFQFITKPVNAKLFNEEISRAIRIYKNNNRSFLFYTAQGSKLIRLKDIVYIETSYRYFRVKTHQDSYYGSARTFLYQKKLLLEGSFTMTDRSIMVNLQHVDVFDKNTVTLTDGSVIEISRKKVKEFKREYFKYMK